MEKIEEIYPNPRFAKNKIRFADREIEADVDEEMYYNNPYAMYTPEPQGMYDYYQEGQPQQSYHPSKTKKSASRQSVKSKQSSSVKSHHSAKASSKEATEEKIDSPLRSSGDKQEEFDSEEDEDDYIEV